VVRRAEDELECAPIEPRDPGVPGLRVIAEQSIERLCCPLVELAARLVEPDLDALVRVQVRDAERGQRREIEARGRS